MAGHFNAQGQGHLPFPSDPWSTLNTHTIASTPWSGIHQVPSEGTSLQEGNCPLAERASTRAPSSQETSASSHRKLTMARHSDRRTSHSSHRPRRLYPRDRTGSAADHDHWNHHGGHGGKRRQRHSTLSSYDDDTPSLGSTDHYDASAYLQESGHFSSRVGTLEMEDLCYGIGAWSFENADTRIDEETASDDKPKYTKQKGEGKGKGKKKGNKSRNEERQSNYRDIWSEASGSERQ